MRQFTSALRNVLIVIPQTDIVEKKKFEDRVRRRNSESPINLDQLPQGLKHLAALSGSSLGEVKVSVLHLVNSK